jgi:hypothetical protein
MESTGFEVVVVVVAVIIIKLMKTEARHKLLRNHWRKRNF